MPKITKSDKIDVLNYVININVPDGKRRSYTNLSKAKITDIDKLLEKNGVNDANFNEYYKKIKNQENLACEMYKHQQKLLAEERKFNEERRQMEDEDLLSQFNSVPDAIKLLCEKKRLYEDYCIELKAKNIHIKNAENMFNKTKRSNLDTLTWRDGDAELCVGGINIVVSHLGGRWRHPFGGIHRQRTTKEIIEDYKKGLIPVWFKIKTKVKKNRSKKV